jgi:hypothetical protein
MRISRILVKQQNVFFIFNSLKNASQIFFNSYKIFEKRHFKGFLMIKKRFIIIADHYGHTRRNTSTSG